MIHVTVFKKSGLYQGFNVSGHAGYDVSGRDIVCAAVSALVINFINSIETFTADQFTVAEDEDAGMIDFKFLGCAGRESILLMDSLVLGLRNILEDNRQYIQLEIKEV